jgi:hypothetical protein
VPDLAVAAMARHAPVLRGSPLSLDMTEVATVLDKTPCFSWAWLVFEAFDG